jgi:hypothetical protein
MMGLHSLVKLEDGYATQQRMRNRNTIFFSFHILFKKGVIIIMNVNIEEEINSSFIKQINELPSDLKDPVENTLEYIKKRAKCNDYEAAQIQFLMIEQSAQKTGYKYYCRYIAGQSTTEEDSADYYKSIRKSWNRFLDKFSKMSLDERVEAFTVYSGAEKALEILEDSSGDKLDFITKKTSVKLDALETKAEELESKSTPYLTTHLSYTLDSAKEIENKSDEYFDSVIRSEIEYNITSNRDSKEEEFSLPKKEEIVDNSTDDDESIGSAVIKIIVGIVSLVLGIVLLKAAMGSTILTAGVSAAIAPPAIGLIITGLTSILKGIQKLIENIIKIIKKNRRLNNEYQCKYK